MCLRSGVTELNSTRANTLTPGLHLSRYIAEKLGFLRGTELVMLQDKIKALRLVIASSRAPSACVESVEKHGEAFVAESPVLLR